MVLYFVIADFALRLLRLCRIIKAALRKKELCYVVLPTVQIVCWFILHHNEKLIRPINNEWESLRVMGFFPVWDYISLFSPHFILFFSSQNSDSDLFSLRKNPWSVCPLFCKHLLFPIFKKMQKKTLKDVTVFSGSDRLRSHSLYLYNSFQLNTYTLTCRLHWLPCQNKMTSEIMRGFTWEMTACMGVPTSVESTPELYFVSNTKRNKEKQRNTNNTSQ